MRAKLEEIPIVKLIGALIAWRSRLLMQQHSSSA